jgi:peptide deformylase
MSGSAGGVRLHIEQVGADVLRHRAREVTLEELATPAVQSLIDMMLATVSGIGVGLAAPQVGMGLRIAVIEDRAEYHDAIPDEVLRAQERVPVEAEVLVNPVLAVEDDSPVEHFEGCLSVDGYRAVVPRARGVRVTAWDRHGRPVEHSAVGWYARILQHEVDHLDGIIYVDRMLTRSFVSGSSTTPWGRLPITEVKERLWPSEPPS